MLKMSIGVVSLQDGSSLSRAAPLMIWPRHRRSRVQHRNGRIPGGFDRPIVSEVRFWCSLFPLIGNYGVSEASHVDTKRIISASTNPSGYRFRACSFGSVHEYSHWNSAKSLSAWLHEERMPALYGVDTRAVTKHLREQGSLLGGISVDPVPQDFPDPNLKICFPRSALGNLRSLVPGASASCSSIAAPKRTSFGNFSSAMFQFFAFRGLQRLSW